jgi:integrase
VSARTRSWEQAELVGQAERDKRDPVKIELKKIAVAEEVKRQAERAQLRLLDDALSQFLNENKNIKATSLAAYESTQRKILKWAGTIGIEYVSDVTSDHLSKWKAQWSPDAKDKLNRMSLTSQVALQTRIRSFFRWAHAHGIIKRNPAAPLRAINPGESETMPLTPIQFEELLAATEKLDTEMRYKQAKVGKHLRAVFLVQRWTGLRIGDALQIRRSALAGSRLPLTMQKRSNDHTCILPDEVVAALNSLPKIKGVDDDHYFVSAKTRVLTETNKWVRKVARLNKYLDFNHPVTSEPMDFHSHMLRDTFAVEMLKASVPLERVSKMLGHKSVTTTERYYAKWVPDRLKMLEDEAVVAMRKMGAKFSGD